MPKLSARQSSSLTTFRGQTFIAPGVPVPGISNGTVLISVFRGWSAAHIGANPPFGCRHKIQKRLHRRAGQLVLRFGDGGAQILSAAEQHPICLFFNSIR